MWIFDVAMKMWMRAFSAWRTASHARSTSLKPVRDRPVMIGPRTVLAIASTDSKSPSDAIGKPASITSTPEARELVGDLELLADVERDAGRLFAVSQGRVEDLDRVHLVRLWLRFGSCGEGYLPQRKTLRPDRHGGSSASTGGRPRLHKEEAQQSCGSRCLLAHKSHQSASVRSVSSNTSVGSYLPRHERIQRMRTSVKRALGVGVIGGVAFAAWHACEHTPCRDRPRGLEWEAAPFPFPPVPPPLAARSGSPPRLAVVGARCGRSSPADPSGQAPPVDSRALVDSRTALPSTGRGEALTLTHPHAPSADSAAVLRAANRARGVGGECRRESPVSHTRQGEAAQAAMLSSCARRDANCARAKGLTAATSRAEPRDPIADGLRQFESVSDAGGRVSRGRWRGRTGRRLARDLRRPLPRARGCRSRSPSARLRRSGSGPRPCWRCSGRRRRALSPTRPIMPGLSSLCTTSM